MANEKCGDQNVGLACTEEGLFLGRTPLVERHGRLYAVRPKGDLERLLSKAYGADIVVDRLLPSLVTVAGALSKDGITRAGLEAEDLLIKRRRGDTRFARAAWDEAEHPRTGTAPNPGWFAPKSGPGEHERPTQVGQRGRGEREPEDILDPMGSVRQAMWDARISLLRMIDPDNPNLTYFSNPSSPPSQEALDRLDATIEAASIKRVTDNVMPNGMPNWPAGQQYENS